MRFRSLAAKKLGRTLLVGASVPCTAWLCSTAGRAEFRPPIKLAVFEFELDDFSAGGPLAGESAAETARLQRVVLQARQQLAQSNLFDIVDVSAASDERVRTHRLRKCNGCEADTARALGAEMAFAAFSARSA